MDEFNRWNKLIDTINADGKYNFKHTRYEMQEFIERLNYEVQYLGLDHKDLIYIVDSLYRSDV